MKGTEIGKELHRQLDAVIKEIKDLAIQLGNGKMGPDGQVILIYFSQDIIDKYTKQTDKLIRKSLSEYNKIPLSRFVNDPRKNGPTTREKITEFYSKAKNTREQFGKFCADMQRRKVRTTLHPAESYLQDKVFADYKEKHPEKFIKNYYDDEIEVENYNLSHPDLSCYDDWEGGRGRNRDIED